MNSGATNPERTRILLTGAPGVGKTTVLMRLSKLLSNHALGGFYTEEIREHGQRSGFRVITLAGQTATLAHVSIKGKQRVSRYGVDVAAFERLVLPELARAVEVVLIDEIGRMECFSRRFVTAVRSLFDRDAPVVATVAMRGEGFIAEVKARPDVEIWHVTRADRDTMPQLLADRLLASLA